MILSVLGDTFADIVCRPLDKLPTWGTDCMVTEPIRIMLGGSAANIAVHTGNLNRAANLNKEGGEGKGRGGALADAESARGGQSCVLHTSVGSDDLGDFVRKKLDDFGVEWSQTKRRGHQGACVVLSGREDRGFVSHRGSTAQFCREDIDVPRLMASDHVHVAGFYNCPSLAKDLPGLLAEVREGGATCSLGPQWDASEEWGGLDLLYPSLDVFIPNEDEALNISRCTDVNNAASFFLDKGVGLVVVTLGKRGAFAVSRRSGSGAGGGETRETAGRWEQSSLPVEVVDTTGAGDAFAAGFLHVWKATGDVQEALRWGCALGSTVVTREGATCRLSVDEDIRPNLMLR